MACSQCYQTVRKCILFYALWCTIVMAPNGSSPSQGRHNHLLLKKSKTILTYFSFIEFSQAHFFFLFMIEFLIGLIWCPLLIKWLPHDPLTQWWAVLQFIIQMLLKFYQHIWRPTQLKEAEPGRLSSVLQFSKQQYVLVHNIKQLNTEEALYSGWYIQNADLWPFQMHNSTNGQLQRSWPSFSLLFLICA